MKYDFDEIIPRSNTSSVKWDKRPGVLPLWVADMDFKAAPCILDAIRAKLDHGIFGYSLVPDSYYDAVRWWLSHRYGLQIEKEWITPIGGLVPAATIALLACTEPGDEVIIQTPAYNCFFKNVDHAGCKLSENKLLYDGERWSIDFDDFERRARSAKAFLLCNPQNPVGRLWTAQELEKMGDICARNGVTVISDEIHIDIVPPGSHGTAFASIKDSFKSSCIFFNSPTKCFNIAGLHISNIICADPQLRGRIVEQLCRTEHSDVNQIGIAALQGAFTPEGEEWLDQMNAYIHDNYLMLRERLEKELPKCRISPLEATYLVWVDCHFLKTGTQEAMEKLASEHKVWVNSGDMYGAPGFLRINIACPRATLQEALDRIVKGLSELYL